MGAPGKSTAQLRTRLLVEGHEPRTIVRASCGERVEEEGLREQGSTESAASP